MKFRLFLSIILLSSIQPLQAMRGGMVTMRISEMLQIQFEEEIREHIKGGNIEALKALLQKANGFQKDYFMNSGITCAMEANQLPIIKFLLDHGMPIPQALPNCSPDSLKTLFTHAVVRPSNYALQCAPKRIVAFLCTIKKVYPRVPNPVRLLILKHAGFIGDLMIKKLLAGQPLPNGFSGYARNRLLGCTIAHFEHLRRKALEQNPRSNIPEPRNFKKEIRSTIASPKVIKPYFCNAKEEEPPTICTIM